MITGWSSVRHDALHRRALELQPAIALAGLRGSAEDLEVLYQEYLDAARRLRIFEREAWMVFSLASVNWAQLLIVERAERDGIDVETATQMTILATKSTVADRG